MKINFNCGKANKGDNGCNKPFLGHMWGYWLPYFHWNKGNIFKKQVFDGTVSWLFFWVGITIWPSWKKENQDDCRIGSQEARP